MENQLNCSVSRAIIFLLFLASVGCAGHPLSQQWDFSSGREHFRKSYNPEKYKARMMEENARMEEIYKEYPHWRTTRAVDDEVTVVCEKSGNKTVCVGK